MILTASYTTRWDTICMSEGRDFNPAIQALGCRPRCNPRKPAAEKRTVGRRSILLSLIRYLHRMTGRDRSIFNILARRTEVKG